MYSGRVQHELTKTDAILLEAYERDGPVTFRFAQPYRIDQHGTEGAMKRAHRVLDPFLPAVANRRLTPR